MRSRSRRPLTSAASSSKENKHGRSLQAGPFGPISYSGSVNGILGAGVVTRFAVSVTSLQSGRIDASGSLYNGNDGSAFTAQLIVPGMFGDASNALATGVSGSLTLTPTGTWTELGRSLSLSTSMSGTGDGFSSTVSYGYTDSAGAASSLSVSISQTQNSQGFSQSGTLTPTGISGFETTSYTLSSNWADTSSITESLSLTYGSASISQSATANFGYTSTGFHMTTTMTPTGWTNAPDLKETYILLSSNWANTASISQSLDLRYGATGASGTWSIAQTSTTAVASESFNLALTATPSGFGSDWPDSRVVSNTFNVNWAGSDTFTQTNTLTIGGASWLSVTESMTVSWTSTTSSIMITGTPAGSELSSWAQPLTSSLQINWAGFDNPGSCAGSQANTNVVPTGLSRTSGFTGCFSQASSINWGALSGSVYPVMLYQQFGQFWSGDWAGNYFVIDPLPQATAPWQDFQRVYNSFQLDWSGNEYFTQTDYWAWGPVNAATSTVTQSFYVNWAGSQFSSTMTATPTGISWATAPMSNTFSVNWATPDSITQSNTWYATIDGTYMSLTESFSQTTSGSGYTQAFSVTPVGISGFEAYAQNVNLNWGSGYFNSNIGFTYGSSTSLATTISQTSGDSGFSQYQSMTPVGIGPLDLSSVDLFDWGLPTAFTLEPYTNNLTVAWGDPVYPGTTTANAYQETGVNFRVQNFAGTTCWLSYQWRCSE